MARKPPLPEEAIGEYGLHRTSRDRLSILLKLEQEYSVWDQAKRELKHLPYFDRLSFQEQPWPQSLGDDELENINEFPYQDISRKRIHKMNPYFTISLEARAWAALEDYKHKKWKLHRDRRSRLRTPSSGRTQGLTYTISEHLGRPTDHNLSRYGMALELPSKRREVPWIDKLLKYPRRSFHDE